MKKILISAIIFLSVIPRTVSAQAADSDGDGIKDADEINIFHTDPLGKDTDRDGFSDWIELNSGYSPLNPAVVTLERNDHDQDGLSDRMELNFGSNLSDKDTDHDAFSDKQEIDNGFDPTRRNVKLEKIIRVDTATQKLEYFLGKVRLGKFAVSTGKSSTPTPKGIFTVASKVKKAWSRPYGLWMPYWLGLGSGKFGIHELPIWPGGYREGGDHLGTPVSHGCIRLGIGPAEGLYNWADIGTAVHTNRRNKQKYGRKNKKNHRRAETCAAGRRRRHRIYRL